MEQRPKEGERASTLHLGRSLRTTEEVVPGEALRHSPGGQAPWLHVATGWLLLLCCEQSAGTGVRVAGGWHLADLTLTSQTPGCLIKDCRCAYGPRYI